MAKGEMNQKLVYCGSVAWDWIGRRSAKGAPPKEEMQVLEFASPHVYGPAIDLNIKSAITSNTASHCVLIDSNLEIYLDQDNLYIFGRGDKGQLGNGSKKNSDHPVKITIGDEKFKTAAVGRAHTIIVTLSGKVYGAGDNKFFQAIGKSGSDVNIFTLIPGFGDEKVVACSCGAEFSIVLTESGKMYTWGNPQYGQLGINATKEYIGPNNRIIFTPQPPTLIKMEANIVQVSAGINHAFCLDDKGQLYAWGFAGFGRLGLNHSPPKDVLVPTAIPGFLERNNPIKKVEAGQCCGLAIDSNNALHLWGKWKNSGDGGQGTPWLYPKHFSGLSGWHIKDISAGQNQLFALGDNSCISWGQSCNHGELGHGDDKPRSATNAVKVEDLEEFELFQVSCGLGHTLLVVDANDPKFSKLPVCLEAKKAEYS